MSLIAEMSEKSWRRTIDGYLTSVFLCMRYELPGMLAAKRGVIVNMSSIYGLRGHAIQGGGAYAAAKHGVLGLTKSAALQYGPSGVRITAICPGWVSTPPVTNWMSRDPGFASTITGLTPLGRVTTPEEIANAVLWLCSEAASPMIGSPLIVDGGSMA
jgi:NAD(P)-dependent dehydrogenase (short-subunit alcohol dehydrogenase family)